MCLSRPTASCLPIDTRCTSRYCGGRFSFTLARLDSLLERLERALGPADRALRAVPQLSAHFVGRQRETEMHELRTRLAGTADLQILTATRGWPGVGYFRSGSWPASHSRVLLNPTTVGTSRYRYRGAAIPTPWPATA